MNLRDLRYVVAVCDQRHFGRAAETCHVSQPALSGQIRKLEDDLGVALFERTNRAVYVTPVGEAIVAQARQVLALADEIVETARAAKDPLSGEFSLGMIQTIGPYLSPLVLSTIREELPDLSLTLMEGQTADLENRMANGELDGAVLATVPDDPRLREIALYDEPFWIALSQGHPLAGREAIDLGDLRNEELLLLADGHCLRDQVLDACHAATGTTEANTRHTSLETLLALAAAGDGVTLMPALSKLRRDSLGRAIVLRPEASGSAGRTVRLACRKTFPRTELVERLAAIIRAGVPRDLVTVLD
ncbi:MAG: LysR substrate-binding domain-containing protein [Alphaproteobacteria bacterium]|jgi:LysR family hydrogen peroxide-inducible transcriptional activator|nr:LysR substrate-binding domain-containing protein [Alphaproteobacteria bacterium]